MNTMLQKSFFPKDTPKHKIIRSVKEEGFDPILIADRPHRVYHKHKHPETKLLVGLEGSMQIKVKGEKFNLEPGDKLIIPGNTFHSAVAGENGCKFYWSEKIL